MTTVLVIDDDEDIQVLVNAALKSKFTLIKAMTGSEALDAFENQGPFDLILLDVNLPDMDGHDILQDIRKEDSETPVVLLTAEHASATIGPLLRLGVSNYIHKPFNPRELLGRITSIIGDPADADGAAGGDGAVDKDKERDALIAKHGTMFSVLTGVLGDLEKSKIYIENHYDGDWTRLADWSSRYLSRKGLLDSLPASLHNYFNFERYAADRAEAGEILVIEVGPTFHVFSDLPK